MCGRFILAPELQGMLWTDLIQLYPPDFQLRPRYNIAPTQNIPIVRNDGTQNRLSIVRWGLVPFYEKEFKTKYSMINARDDRILESRVYQGPFKSRRCLIPATGFYEWRKGPGKSKQPMAIGLKSGDTFAFAGIWEWWKDKENPDAEEKLSCSIITTRPNSLMQAIHDRMPVILSPDLYMDWLNTENQDLGELKEFLLPFDPALMEAHPVSDKVNSVKNDGPELIEPIESLPGL